MIALVGYYWYGLLIAFGIGLITAWWTWAPLPVPVPIEIDPDDEMIDWTAERSADPDNAADNKTVIESVAAPEPFEQDNEPFHASADDLGPAIAASAAVASAAVGAEPVESLDSDAGAATDDLMIIKGIGPQLDALLRSLGVERFEDIAGWMPEDIERIDDQLGIFKGRILRDEWIGQARLLAKGDMESFTQRYGHLS